MWTTVMVISLWCWTMCSTPTMACRCYTEPTLDVMLPDATISMFRGMIVPRRILTSLSFSNDHAPDNHLSDEYTVWIQKVYRHGCHNASTANDASPPVVELRAYQTLTIVSPRNSCGVSSLPLFRTFLFTGVVSYQDEDNDNRMLQQKEEEEEEIAFPPSATSQNTTTSITETLTHSSLLRRTTSTDVGKASSTTMTMMMHVDVCSNYISPWRSVTRTEQHQLSMVETNRQDCQ